MPALMQAPAGVPGGVPGQSQNQWNLNRAPGYFPQNTQNLNQAGPGVKPSGNQDGNAPMYTADQVVAAGHMNPNYFKQHGPSLFPGISGAPAWANTQGTAAVPGRWGNQTPHDMPNVPWQNQPSSSSLPPPPSMPTGVHTQPFLNPNAYSMRNPLQRPANPLPDDYAKWTSEQQKPPGRSGSQDEYNEWLMSPFANPFAAANPEYAPGINNESAKLNQHINDQLAINKAQPVAGVPGAPQPPSTPMQPTRVPPAPRPSNMGGPDLSGSLRPSLPSMAPARANVADNIPGYDRYHPLNNPATPPLPPRPQPADPTQGLRPQPTYTQGPEGMYPGLPRPPQLYPPTPPVILNRPQLDRFSRSQPRPADLEMPPAQYNHPGLDTDFSAMRQEPNSIQQFRDLQGGGIGAPPAPPAQGALAYPPRPSAPMPPNVLSPGGAIAAGNGGDWGATPGENKYAMEAARLESSYNPEAMTQDEDTMGRMSQSPRAGLPQFNTAVPGAARKFLPSPLYRADPSQPGWRPTNGAVLENHMAADAIERDQGAAAAQRAADPFATVGGGVNPYRGTRMGELAAAGNPNWQAARDATGALGVQGHVTPGGQTPLAGEAAMDARLARGFTPGAALSLPNVGVPRGFVAGPNIVDRQGSNPGVAATSAPRFEPFANTATQVDRERMAAMSHPEGDSLHAPMEAKRNATIAGANDRWHAAQDARNASYGLTRVGIPGATAHAIANGAYSDEMSRDIMEGVREQKLAALASRAGTQHMRGVPGGAANGKLAMMDRMMTDDGKWTPAGATAQKFQIDMAPNIPDAQKKALKDEIDKNTAQHSQGQPFVRVPGAAGRTATPAATAPAVQPLVPGGSSIPHERRSELSEAARAAEDAKDANARQRHSAIANDLADKGAAP